MHGPTTWELNNVFVPSKSFERVGLMFEKKIEKGTTQVK